MPLFAVQLAYSETVDMVMCLINDINSNDETDGGASGKEHSSVNNTVLRKWKKVIFFNIFFCVNYMDFYKKCSSARETTCNICLKDFRLF